MIVHLRVVPGFGIAVEEIRRPDLRSHPVILGGLPRQRGAVREANIEAQRRGIRSGMPLSQAYHHCPEGIFLQPDLPRYESAWQTVCDILRRFTPLVEPIELGGAVLDLSGCNALRAGGLEAARAIAGAVRQGTGIMPWLGVASNRLVAQLASTVVGAEGVSVIERGQEAAFLADLPLTLLPGIDARLALTFQVLGLRTIGQFAALPRASVKRRFGSLGEQLHQYAHGIDRRPVVPPREKLSIAARRECEDGSIEEAVALLHALAEECAEELNRRSLAGTLVELTLEFGSASVPPLPAPSLPPEPAEPLPLPSPPAETLPVPYRIHSMLPQPGERRPTSAPFGAALAPLHTAPHAALPDPVPAVGARTTVRTPVNTAPRLVEIAHRLLLQHWPKERISLQALQLTVSEFPAPRQLSFTELNRIGETGGLAGPSRERIQALAEGEEVLAARYGDASFRHVGQVDPGNILTERRVRLNVGLPWDLS